MCAGLPRNLKRFVSSSVVCRQRVFKKRDQTLEGWTQSRFNQCRGPHFRDVFEFGMFVFPSFSSCQFMSLVTRHSWHFPGWNLRIDWTLSSPGSSSWFFHLPPATPATMIWIKVLMQILPNLGDLGNMQCDELKIWLKLRIWLIYYITYSHLLIICAQGWTNQWQKRPMPLLKVFVNLFFGLQSVANSKSLTHVTVTSYHFEANWTEVGAMVMYHEASKIVKPKMDYLKVPKVGQRFVKASKIQKFEFRHSKPSKYGRYRKQSSTKLALSWLQYLCLQ